MKICFVGSAKSIHMQRWAKWFAERGHEVHLISPNYEDIEGVKIHLIGKKEGSVTNFIRKMLQTRKLVWKIKPDILHAHYVFGYGTFAAFANYHPFVVSAWGSDIATEAEQSLLRKTFVKLTLKKTDLVHVGDKYGRNRLIRLGCKESKIIVKPFGVDTKLFSPQARSESLRAELGIESSPSIIFTRRLDWKYRAEILFKAIPKVIKRIPDAKFIVVAYGPRLQEFKEYIKKHGCEKNVRFVPYIPHSEMPRYLASVDIYVDTFFSPLDVEGHGIGVTTLEAMSCGTPQIMPQRVDLSHETEWFQGVLYKKGDPDSLAEAIIYLLKNEEIRKEIGKKSRRIALKIGDNEKIMKEFLDLYQQISVEETRYRYK